EEYRDAVIEWQQENLEVSISFEKISGVYGFEQETIGTFYELNIKQIINNMYNPYLFISEMDGIVFKENYLESEESGYKYIALKNDKSVGFFTTENLEIADLPVFISPGLGRLTLSGVHVGEEQPEAINFALLTMVLILVLLLGIIGYIFLQEWYKKQYENYLFRDQTNLYNLIHYIDNTKRKGFNENEIEMKLRGVGWNSEQINYAMRKYAGKRTGMIEIPIDKIFKSFGKKSAQTEPIQNPPKSVVPFPIRPKIPSGIVNRESFKQKEMFFRK
ncbi:hypothetical protein KKG22_06465, partial [Patescibacteria group bacterium]|nr:hypothetical protein [Patescibacteria group bacterium]